MDWNTVLARYDAHQRAASLSVRTIDNRRQMLERLARVSGVSPQRLTLDDLVGFLNRPHTRTGGEMAPGSKQVERSYLQCFGHWMVEEGYVEKSPAARLPRVRVPRRRARPIHLAHVKALFELNVWQCTKDLIVVLANTGLRIGEAVRIRGEDYDRIGRTLRVVRKGGLVQVLQLPEAVIEIAERMPQNGWWFPSPYASSEFPEGGGHVLMKSASTKIGHALRKIGISDPKITGHSIRHFYACMLIANGTPIHVVQEMLGHASLATTQLYVLVEEDEIRAAVKRIPRIAPTRQDLRIRGRRRVA